ncbi:MAG: hypothetical protein NDJ94_04755 [Vicinamibacteria bacterium]|nr:hypothetical protein [Vicinamibacteria bacterium]
MRPMKKLVKRDALLLALAALLFAALGASAWQAEIGDFVPSEQVPADSAVSFPVDI